MEWLFIFGLAAVAWWQTARVAALSRRVGELERRLGVAAPAPRPERAAAPVAAQEPLVLDTPLRPHETEPPLVLDTPLPPASNDLDDAAATVPSPPTTAAAPLTLAPAAPAATETPAPRAAAARRALPYSQALGALAIVAAFAAPWLAGAVQWPAPALTLYLAVIGAAGFALAAWRRWPWAALASAGGLYLWFAAAIGADEVRRAMALLSFASLGGVTMAMRPSHENEAPGIISWRSVRTYGPAIAICISSVLLIWAWLAVAPTPAGQIAGPALIAVFHVALAAYAVRARVADAATLFIAVAGLAFGFMAYLRARFFFPPLGADFYPTILFAAFAVAISALSAQPHRRSRALVAGAGAIGAALLIVLAAFSRDAWHSLAAWAPLFAGGAAAGIAAWLTEKNAPTPATDRSVNLWAGAGAALVLLGVESAFPALARVTAYAAAACLFAGGVAWRDWRALRWAAPIAAALALAHAIGPSLWAAVLAGAIPLGGGLTILAAAAGLLFAAGYLGALRAPRTMATESLGLAGVFMLACGALLALRWIAANNAAAIGPFVEAALQASLLLVVGHVVLARPRQSLGRIGAWRGHIFFGAGLVLAFFTLALTLNPWWGGTPAQVTGPPIFNALALAFLAPAALVFAAAYRLYGRQRRAARWYAAAGGIFVLLWAFSETRRGFHGADMATAPVGLFEGGVYALLFLSVAAAVAIAARTMQKRRPSAPFTQDLAALAPRFALASVGVASVILLLARHPIWGLQDVEATKALSTLLGVAAQFAAVLLALLLARVLSVAPGPNAARFAAAAATALFAWSFGHTLIRWFEQRGYMDNGAAVSGLEGFGHALWPLLLVLAGAAATARAPGRDTSRFYLRDLQAIWASAVWPALGFSGLGLWLLFNPWWGIWPASTPLAANAAAPTVLLAAGLAALAPRVTGARWPEWLLRAATLAVMAHLLTALALIVRNFYHPGDLAAPGASQAELWTYSGAFALFAGGVLLFGIQRNDALLRRSGLAIFAATLAKVFLIDLAPLSVAVRIAIFVAIGAVLLGAVWLARRRAPARPKPTDLLPITPSARRGTRRGRRQRTQ